MTKTPEFDVLLSFAGPERHFARAIHDIAKANGLTVFLDEEFQHEIWGKNIVEYLDQTYRDRGQYVVTLLSEAYRARAYTRVERRAAFDRMINEAAEYILPVKVDDTWIDGLPRSTAYIDLRTSGILGVCELLVKKILGTTKKLSIPPELRIPRVPLGQLPGNHFAEYLIELCSRQGITSFGALIYNERNVALRKLLRDKDYWDALDHASGLDFEVFSLQDSEEYGSDETFSLEMMTAASLSQMVNWGQTRFNLIH